MLLHPNVWIAHLSQDTTHVVDPGTLDFAGRTGLQGMEKVCVASRAHIPCCPPVLRTSTKPTVCQALSWA